MELKIKIDNLVEEEYFLNVAVENGLTPDEYAKNIIVGWIKDHINGIYINAIRHLPTKDVVEMLGHYKKYQKI